jgi:hypothetical protein
MRTVVQFVPNETPRWSELIEALFKHMHSPIHPHQYRIANLAIPPSPCKPTTTTTANSVEMARTAATKLVLVALVVAMLLVASDAAISCGQVNSALASCVSYAKGSGASPPGACCSGVRRLAGLARSTADKQAACRCIKSAAGGLNPGKAASIPSKCGVSIPYSISASVDCSKIH